MPEQIKYPLNQLYVYLTKGCNLACRHCWIDPKYQGKSTNYPMLDLELFKSIIDQALPLGLGSVKLTGGEPLIHPKIIGILDFLKERKIRLNMETNGVLCSTELARKIAEGNRAFISVSIDGADERTHDWIRGVPGAFEAALTGIRNLVKAGLKPQIIMTLMRKNVDQLEAVIDMATELGAGSVKVNFVQPMGRGEQMHEMVEDLPIEELLEIGKWVETRIGAVAGKIPVYFSHPRAFQPLGKVLGGHDGGTCGVCGILGVLGVLAEGSYALCGIGETVPEFIFGNASTDRLEDIWENTTTLKQIREVIPDKLEGVCGLCVMKNICFGHCVAQNFYASKSLLAPYWYCEMAHEKGLFPKSRLKARMEDIFNAV